MLPASLSGAGATAVLLFFYTNRPTQRLAAPATFPSNQQAVKRTLEIPLNVLRVASLELEVLSWHGRRCSCGRISESRLFFSSGFFPRLLYFMIGFTLTPQF